MGINSVCGQGPQGTEGLTWLTCSLSISRPLPFATCPSWAGGHGHTAEPHPTHFRLRFRTLVADHGIKNDPGVGTTHHVLMSLILTLITLSPLFFFNIKNILEPPLNILNWGSLGNLPLLRGRLAEWLSRFRSQMPWI